MVSLPAELPGKPRFNMCCAVLCLVIQLGPTLCNPMDFNLPGSSFHGDSPGKSIGVGCQAPTQKSNPGLPHCRWILYCLSHQGSPMTNLDRILKSRDITLPTKVHLVKAMVFPVVIYGCESWTKKKAEHQRTDAFELWGWKRLLRVPWTARRSNQSILMEISPECSLEGLMLKLKLQ